MHSGVGLGKIQTRRRALNALSEGHAMSLKRVEPRINSSLRGEFIRFVVICATKQSQKATA